MTDVANTTFTQVRISPVEWIQQHIRQFNAVCLAVVLVLLIMYIVQVNKSVAAGYEIRELESQIKTLSLEGQKLEIAVRQGQSLEQVTRAVKMIGLVQAGRPEYVHASDPVFALAQ